MIALQKVSYTYPFQDRPAAKGIDLSIRPGEAVLLTGASGCGKTTVVRLVNGLCPHFFKGAVDGCVRIDGRDNAQRRLVDIARDVGTLFQDPEQQFFATTVEDEIALVHEWRGKNAEAIRANVDAAASRFGLDALRSRSLLCLSEGEKQIVALAAVMSLVPRGLVLDEPTANLDPEATIRLAETIRDLKRQGLAILIADHRLYWLEDVVDRVAIMRKGRIVAEGGFDLLSDGDIRDRCGLRRPRIGDRRRSLPEVNGAESLLRVERLCFAYGNGPDLFNGASFGLPRGVTGLLGPNGAGKTTLARLLTGLTPPRSGRLHLKGKETSHRRMLQRSSIVLQNADHQLHMKTVHQELLLSACMLPEKERASAATALLDRFGLAHLAARHPQSLSGGEKQRLTIACAMAKKPDILILDEPTSGVDGLNLRRIAAAIRRSAGHGACVLLISHDLELIDKACDFALRLPFNTFSAKENAA
jgi:energy-coupling factor transport system ATP-binding protein